MGLPSRDPRAVASSALEAFAIRDSRFLALAADHARTFEEKINIGKNFVEVGKNFAWRFWFRPRRHFSGPAQLMREKARPEKVWTRLARG